MHPTIEKLLIGVQGDVWRVMGNVRLPPVHGADRSLGYDNDSFILRS